MKFLNSRINISLLNFELFKIKRNNSYPKKFLPRVLIPFVLLGCTPSKEIKRENLSSPAISQKQAASISEIHIIEDEPIVKGSQVKIVGRLLNKSERMLEKLSLEMELISRSDGSASLKKTSITPSILKPKQSGEYSFTISNREWKSSRILRVLSETDAQEIAFTYEQGAKRPLERAPEGKTIVVKRPKQQGEEFLNTPDDPINIP